MPRLTLNDIINIANRGYADWLIADYWNFKASKPKVSRERKDTFALALVRELHDTYDDSASDKQKIATAIEQTQAAILDYEGVISAFESYDPAEIPVEIPGDIKLGTPKFNRMIMSAIPEGKTFVSFRKDTSYRHGNAYWLVRVK